MRFTICHLALFVALLPLAKAGAEGYRDAKAGQPVFDHEQLGLMAIEREKLATELGAYVSNELGRGAKAEGDEASKLLNLANRMLAVALQMHPRNRIALVANFKLLRGLPTELVSADYEPEVLAQYLYTRSKLLVEQGGEPNDALAAYLLAFAVEIDPTNEDAIFDLEIREVDGKAANWERLLPGLQPRPKVAASGGADASPGSEAGKTKPADTVEPPKVTPRQVPKPSFEGFPKITD